MTEKIEPRDRDEIDCLVRSEVDQALETFRAGDFEARLRRRIAVEGSPAKRTTPPLLKIAVPAAGAVLMMAVVAAVAIFRPGPVLAPIEAGPIAAVLREMPPFSASAPGLPRGPADAAPVPVTESSFSSVLEAAGAGKDRQAGPGPAGTVARKVAPFSMRKRMEILFKDKVIERVLSSCAPRSKEV